MKVARRFGDGFGVLKWSVPEGRDESSPPL
jgi:hypothetical protein